MAIFTVKDSACRSVIYELPENASLGILPDGTFVCLVYPENVFVKLTPKQVSAQFNIPLAKKVGSQD